MVTTLELFPFDYILLLPNYAENRFQQFGGNVLIEGLTLQHCLTLK